MSSSEKEVVLTFHVGNVELSRVLIPACRPAGSKDSGRWGLGRTGPVGAQRAAMASAGRAGRIGLNRMISRNAGLMKHLGERVAEGVRPDKYCDKAAALL